MNQKKPFGMLRLLQGLAAAAIVVLLAFLRLTGDPAEKSAPGDFFRTTYEVFVYSFCDSDGDGIGDLPGLRSKLDYINDGKPGEGEDLGMTGLWLMPVFPSPTYHKYDKTDYKNIDPACGILFLRRGK